MEVGVLLRHENMPTETCACVRSVIQVAGESPRASCRLLCRGAQADLVPLSSTVHSLHWSRNESDWQCMIHTCCIKLPAVNCWLESLDCERVLHMLKVDECIRCHRLIKSQKNTAVIYSNNGWCHNKQISCSLFIVLCTMDYLLHFIIVLSFMLLLSLVQINMPR